MFKNRKACLPGILKHKKSSPLKRITYTEPSGITISDTIGAKAIRTKSQLVNAQRTAKTQYNKSMDKAKQLRSKAEEEKAEQTYAMNQQALAEARGRLRKTGDNPRFISPD